MSPGRPAVDPRVPELPTGPPSGGLLLPCLLLTALLLGGAVGCGEPVAGPVPSGARPGVAMQPPLLPDRPVVLHLADGVRHHHPVHLERGQALRAVAEQRGVDVRLRLYDPRGEPVVEVDGFNGSRGQEHLYAVARRRGVHQLEVRPWSDASRGTYRLHLHPPRSATAADRERAEALRLVDEAMGLADGGPEERRRAARRLRRALELWDRAGEPYFHARTLVRLARLEEGRGELAEAAGLYRHALAGLRTVAARADLPPVLNELADVLRRRGEMAAARRLLDEALTLCRILGKHHEAAVTHNNLALLQRNGGEPWQALDSYERALATFRAAGDHRNVITTLHNLGVLYNWLGKTGAARQALEEALELSRGAGSGHQEATLLTSLGWVELWSGRPRRARELLRRALELRGADRWGRATTLDRLGTVHLELGDLDAARRAYEEAVELLAGTGHAGRAASRANLAEVELRAGELRRALRGFEAALRLGAGHDDPSGRAHMLLGRAKALRSLGDLDAARADLRRAIRLVEGLQRSLPVDNLRSHYLATVHDIYGTLVEILMELHRRQPETGWDGRALEVVERSRARSLLARAALGTAGTGGSAGSAGVAQGEADREEGGFPGPQLTVAQIQRRLLDPETALLVYFLRDERSFLWLLEHDRLLSRELAPRGEIEAGARRLRRLLGADQGGPLEEQATVAAAALSAAVLAPAAERLRARRLLVMADGALQSIPFAALPLPVAGDGGGAGGGEPLLLHHEVQALPSASVQAALLRRAAGRAPAPGLLALLAVPRTPTLEAAPGMTMATAESAAAGDAPDGDHSDSDGHGDLLDRGPPEAGTAAVSLQRSVGELGLEHLPPLPHVRREAASILRLVPAGGGTLAAVGPEASLPAVRGRLGGYRILHFATHALIHADRPELSGVVLADGFLPSRDVAGLDLHSELVVLSACSTAVGKEVWGEGILGLPRSFLAAGATGVVVSLWNVDDRATAVLMEHFYRALLVDRLPPAAALGRAQRALRRSAAWSAPYYWAPFVLVGADPPAGRLRPATSKTSAVPH